MTVDVGRPANLDQVLAYAHAARQSLPFGSVSAEEWVARQPEDEMRVARVAGAVAGGALLCPMAQYFGGQPVPMVGINAVAVAPEHRGRGVGGHLMGAIIDELAERGVALSTLYPATQPIYRAVGYEQAGTRMTYRVPTAAIESRVRDLAIERLDASSLDIVRPVHEQRARWASGNLCRSDWSWSRLLDPIYRDPIAFAVYEAGAVTGYLIARQHWGVHESVHGGRLEVRDLCALTPAAAGRLWSIVADHRSMCQDAVVVDDPVGSSLLGLREQPAEVHQYMRWMVRIVSVEAALTARGYPVGLEAGLELVVEDDRVAGNRGRFTLRVAGGRGRVEPGGAGRLHVHVRDLAPLYTGHVSPHTLAAQGRVEADDDTLAAAAAIFAGPAPSMIDFF